MIKVIATYKNQKHCTVLHTPSGAIIETDAPKDNNGRGELFSPTDLVAASLAACTLTVMSIVAERDGVSIEGATADVEKEMSTTPPRRIVRLTTNIQMPKGINSDYRKKLENTARTCPVHKSLHPDIESPIVFHYSD